MKKQWPIVLILCLVIIIVAMYIQNERLGDREEREQLLTEVMIDLLEVRNVSSDELERVHVRRLEAAIYPFFYVVDVEMSDGTTDTYEWKSAEKEGVVRTNNRSFDQ